MKNIIKILMMVLILGLFLPKVSYAWDDQHQRHDGRGHYHAHANPDLTLVSGMDNIDCKVLVAGSDQD